MDFQFLGYSLEYYQNNKYVGSVKLTKADRPLGYSGRKYQIAEQDIVIYNSINKAKKIRKGTEYYTEIILLCGKLKGSQKEKISRLRSSFEWRNQLKSIGNEL